MPDLEKEGSDVKLPPSRERGGMSPEKTIAKRRLVREYRGGTFIPFSALPGLMG
jgi:hypothetical protein